jgi:hypothetical protein
MVDAIIKQKRNKDMMIAEEILRLEKQWNEMDSTALTENIKAILISRDYAAYKDRINILMEITGSSKFAVGAWFNTSRNNVKIPFLKVCQIADFFNIDLYRVLNEYEYDDDDSSEKYINLSDKIYGNNR